MFTPDKGLSVDAEMTVGDKQEEINVGSDDTTIGEWEQSAEQIINESGIGGWELGLMILLAGWAIPGPLACMRGVGKGIRALFGALRG